MYLASTNLINSYYFQQKDFTRFLKSSEYCVIKHVYKIYFHTFSLIQTKQIRLKHTHLIFRFEHSGF